MKRKRLVGIVVVLLVGVSAACGKKDTKADTTPTDNYDITQRAFKAPNASGTERAEGDVRDAMLALQRVHFGFDSSELTADSRKALDEAAAKLKDHEAVHLYVEGHADQAGETEYNMMLGEKRAKAVSDYLSTMGVAKERLHILSYGEEVPLQEGETRAAMAANRRVDFRVMRGDIELVLEESAPVE